LFSIAFVPGVTVGKWTTAWEQRRADTPLRVIPTLEDRQLAVLRDGLADVSFVRLRTTVDGVGADAAGAAAPGDQFSVIRLYQEVPVAVLPKGHALQRAETLTLHDLAGDTVLAAREPLKDAVELVAAGAGVLLLPQSVARLHNRKDVLARPVVDAPETTIALVWLAEATTADIDEFVGIVRGRSANSSRTRPTPKTAPLPTKKPPVRAPRSGRKRQRPAGGTRRRSR
jgi:DNA-binding transcriptional LysR family regulator